MRAAKIILAGTVIGLGLFVGARLAGAQESENVPPECDPAVAAALRQQVSSLQAQVAALKSELAQAQSSARAAESRAAAAPAEEPRPSRHEALRAARTQSSDEQPAAPASIPQAPGTARQAGGSGGAPSVRPPSPAGPVSAPSSAAQGSGPAPSGSTNIGAVNNSEDAKAKTGDAESSNQATVGTVAGNEAVVDNQTVDSVTQTLVVNDLEIEINQVAVSRSGDAIAGSQVIGVTSSGDCLGSGPTTIHAVNNAEDAKAKTGDAESDNDVRFDGPLVSNTLVANGSTIQGDVNQSIEIRGDIDIEIKQWAEAVSGAATAGSQVIAVHGSSSSCGHTATRTVTVDIANRADDPKGKSGDADTDNGVDLDPPAENVLVMAANETGGAPARLPAVPARDRTSLFVQAVILLGVLSLVEVRRRLLRR